MKPDKPSFASRVCLLRTSDHRLLTYAIALLLLASVCSCTKKPSAADDIQSVFQKYRTALLTGDGEAAWAVLDSHTQNFYSTALQDALTLPKSRLDRLDMIHKLTVLRLRADLRREELQNLTGHDVLVMAVQNGWISKSSVESMTNLHRIEVTDRYAGAFLPESPKIPALYFINEGSEWKLSLFRSFELVNATMRQWRVQSGQTERDFLLGMLRQVSKYEVDEKIWDGPHD